ncbi:hypothetical protein EVAR_45861_1 [Eumeta japonica]|uniref:Uncharacterized protein n=1 Tax=Eumeta variegata TaxID=151549 RepID=A0A4C1WL70_EUMVA|nr:hypothetical protein EVAR_45861_1 [Eumeta japonica]
MREPFHFVSLQRRRRPMTTGRTFNSLTIGSAARRRQNREGPKLARPDFRRVNLTAERRRILHAPLVGGVLMLPLPRPPAEAAQENCPRRADKHAVTDIYNRIAAFRPASDKFLYKLVREGKTRLRKRPICMKYKKLVKFDARAAYVAFAKHVKTKSAPQIVINSVGPRRRRAPAEPRRRRTNFPVKQQK